MNVLLGFMETATVSSEWAITLDVAQLVTLGGLIWGLSQMNATVKQLGALTKELADKLGELDEAHSKTVARVDVLMDRDNQRRDRRKDDRHDDS